MTRKALLFLLLFSPLSAFCFTYDSGGGAAGADQGDVVSGSNANAVIYTNSSKAITTDTSLTYNGTTLGMPGMSNTGNTTLGDASGDSITQNAASVSFPNDTITTLGGGASGWTVRGDVILASNTVIDAYSDSFGAVTAGSTSTVTWTEVTDRLGEFVTSSFTVTLAGYYEIIAHAGISQTAGTGCLILKNNGTSLSGGTVCNQGVTALASILDISLTRILSLAAGDIARIDASATTSNATFQKMTMTIKRVQ